ncbi:MAG: hypothetical protein NTY02_09375 [Acidobacteria bacterium]|nr:hypothetical protein [Acidobacteriota bacterium]
MPKLRLAFSRRRLIAPVSPTPWPRLSINSRQSLSRLRRKLARLVLSEPAALVIIERVIDAMLREGTR